MRKIVSILLCTALLMALAMPAFAEETPDDSIQTAGETDATTPVTTPPPETTTPPTTPSTTPPASQDPSVPAQCIHSWDAGTGSDATCTQSGTKTFTCTLCGGTRTETTPAAGHKYGEWSATVESHSRTCKVCQTTESGGHSISESVSKQPTCKEEGVYAEYCPTCEYIVYEVLPKLTTHTYDNVCDPDCNVCGVVREVKHDLQTWWSKGASGHWHACSKCGYQSDFGKHYPGPAATEDEAQLCLTCGYTLTPRLNHVHEYAEDLTADEEGHWYACSGCEEKKDYKDHDYDDPCDSDCNTCGHKNDNAHTFDGSWHSDEDGHWFVCVTCGGVVEAKDHVAPETVSDVENQYCVECGYLMETAAEHSHTYENTWQMDDTNHWKECACGEISESAAHTWDSGTKDNDQSVYTCSQCGAQHIEAEHGEESEEFPWGIVFIVLVALLIGAIIALIFVLKPKKGKYS